MLHAKTFGQGQPLVILHGLFGMLDNWQTLARQWAEDYHVILLDLRNHGRSLHSDEMNYALMAGDVAVTLEEMGIDVNVTAPMGSQLRVLPDQRAGFRARACRYRVCRAASMV